MRLIKKASDGNFNKCAGVCISYCIVWRVKVPLCIIDFYSNMSSDDIKNYKSVDIINNYYYCSIYGRYISCCGAMCISLCLYSKRVINHLSFISKLTRSNCPKERSKLTQEADRQDRQSWRRERKITYYYHFDTKARKVCTWNW